VCWTIGGAARIVRTDAFARWPDAQEHDEPRRTQMRSQVYTGLQLVDVPTIHFLFFLSFASCARIRFAGAGDSSSSSQYRCSQFVRRYLTRLVAHVRQEAELGHDDIRLMSSLNALGRLYMEQVRVVVFKFLVLVRRRPTTCYLYLPLSLTHTNDAEGLCEGAGVVRARSQHLPAVGRRTPPKDCRSLTD
jgi:hypothetical protein